MEKKQEKGSILLLAEIMYNRIVNKFDKEAISIATDELFRFIRNNLEQKMGINTYSPLDSDSGPDTVDWYRNVSNLKKFISFSFLLFVQYFEDDIEELKAKDDIENIRKYIYNVYEFMVLGKELEELEILKKIPFINKITQESIPMLILTDINVSMEGENTELFSLIGKYDLSKMVMENTVDSNIQKFKSAVITVPEIHNTLMGYFTYI